MLDRRLLYNLCLVNRVFADIFTPKLWAVLEFTERNSSCLLDDDKRKALRGSNNVQHVRILMIRGIEEQEPEARLAIYQGKKHCTYPFNTALLELVRDTASLECFR